MSAPETKEVPAATVKLNNKRRKTVAVGDLHGDYYRLVRILEEEKIVLPETLAWDPDAGNIDLVFIGDYVDWRGEPLEGDPGAWMLGPLRIIKLVMSLYDQANKLREDMPGFSSRVHPILGNHDQMMLDALNIFNFLKDDEVSELIRESGGFWDFQKIFSKKRLPQEGQEAVARFINWYAQGGEITMAAFGGMTAWKDAMCGDTGGFLRNELKMAVEVGGWLYAHTLPDDKKYYRPLDELEKLPGDEMKKAKEEFMWGRSVWGYNYLTGQHIPVPNQKEFEKLLGSMGVEGAVVGHTPISRKDIITAFNGKLINIDLHGIPGSPAWVREWEPDEAEDVE